MSYLEKKKLKIYNILAELPVVAGFKYINVCNLARLIFV